MEDPFFASPPLFLIKAIEPVAAAFKLNTLSAHIHEILFAFFLWHFVHIYISPAVSSRLFPAAYNRLSAHTRVNWDVHVVSFFQSLLINGLALWVIFSDEERMEMDWKGRIWAYDGATGMVQAFAAGYFLWDVMVSSLWFSTLGPGSLMHAIAALLVTCLGFRPFANYYGLNFILYELSTPFLNIHWFCDKLGKTGGRMQLINGILLICTFAGCRLVWGTAQSWAIYQDMLEAFHYKHLGTTSAQLEHQGFQPVVKPGVDIQEAIALAYKKATNRVFPEQSPLTHELDKVLGEPTWSTSLAVFYIFANTTLTILNFYWFFLMVFAVLKRFKTNPSKAKNAFPTQHKADGDDGDGPDVAEKTASRKDTLPKGLNHASVCELIDNGSSGSGFAAIAPSTPRPNLRG